MGHLRYSLGDSLQCADTPKWSPLAQGLPRQSNYEGPSVCCCRLPWYWLALQLSFQWENSWYYSLACTYFVWSCCQGRIKDYAWGHCCLPKQPGCGTGGASAVGPSGACSPALQHWTSQLLRLVITKLGQKPKLGGVRISTDITFMFTHFIPVVSVHTCSLYYPC